MPRVTQEKLVSLLTGPVEDSGFELVHLEYTPGRTGSLLVYIDCEGGVLIEHCEAVSRLVSELLDEADPIPHAYTLEVSSPGFNRPLTRAEHFTRFRGERARIRTREALGGRRNFTGLLTTAPPGCVGLRLDDGTEMEIPLEVIGRANLSPGEPPGSAGRGKEAKRK